MPELENSMQLGVINVTPCNLDLMYFKFGSEGGTTLDLEEGVRFNQVNACWVAKVLAPSEVCLSANDLERRRTVQQWCQALT